METVIGALSFAPTYGTEAALDSVGHRVGQHMTSKELQITGFVMEGISAREIAVRLGINQHAVYYAIRKIFDKIGVFSRLELALYVIYHPALRQSIESPLVGLSPKPHH